MRTASRRDADLDGLMEQASRALADTDYFRAERIAASALEQARQARDYERMARIIMPLQEARRQRLQQALDVGRVTIVLEDPGEEAAVEPGCYLFQPPLVGADARRFRLRAMNQEVPVAIVCREPFTSSRLCPIVALAPGLTMRTKVDPPHDPASPDPAWFVEVLEELGDFAIESIDPAIPTLKRLDQLLLRLEGVPEHENLHQVLEAACRLAAKEEAEHESRKAEPKRRSGGGKRPASS